MNTKFLLILSAFFVLTAPLRASDENPLKGKKLLFCGDSITAAVIHDNGARKPVEERGWASFVGKKNEMAQWTNMGRNGASISDYMAPNIIYYQLDYIASTGEEFDYIILTGGTNDAWYNVDIGEMSDSFEPSGFNRHTFAGGLEYTLYLAKKYFPQSAIGFLINFRHYTTPFPKTWGRLATQTEMRKQYAMASKICKKWGVPCLDLYNNEELTKKLGTDIPADKTVAGIRLRDYHKAVPDQIHPSNVGYGILEPYISEWMKTELAPLCKTAVPAPAAPKAQREKLVRPQIEVLTNPLRDSSVGFMGDAHMQTAAKYFIKNYPMKASRNYAQRGATVGKYDTFPIDYAKNQMCWTRWICAQIGTGSKALDPSHDLLLILSPRTDAEGNLPLGSVSESRNKADFDLLTFAGGLDYFFASLRERAPEMKMVFISFPKMETSSPGRLADVQPYWNLAQKLCEKWDLVFLDLYNSDFVETAEARALEKGSALQWWAPEGDYYFAEYLYECLK